MKSFLPRSRPRFRPMCWRRCGCHRRAVARALARQSRRVAEIQQARPAGRRGSRRFARRREAQCDRDLARGGAMAAVAATRSCCIRRDVAAAHPDPQGRFPDFAVQAAHGNHHDFRGRCVRLGGVAPAGGSQGCGRIAAGGLLHQARSGGVDRVSRQRRRIAVAADPLAGARQAQSCRIAGRRRHAARGRTGCGLRAVGSQSAAKDRRRRSSS